MKRGFVHIWNGGFAVMLSDQGYGLYDDEIEIRVRAMLLVSAYVGGFEPRRKHLISIARVDHVMPKTFAGAYHFAFKEKEGFHRVEKRLCRGDVMACAQSLEAALALQGKLYEIGERAEKTVAVETNPIISQVESRIYEAAEKEVMAALPAVFGGLG